jgi:outer membrane exchange protein TraA
MNDFIERTRVPPEPYWFYYYNLTTKLDLANGYSNPSETSTGDFSDEVSSCESPGCSFFPPALGRQEERTTGFASRFRGYLNVTSDMVNKELHFGLHVDDAVSFVIFDKNNNQYQVAIKHFTFLDRTWRTTNRVIFQKSGLYPIELIYGQGITLGILELSYFTGTFTDFERPLSDSSSLKGSNFILVPVEKFFQTETGRPNGSPDPTKHECMQCSRANANAPGNGGCGLDSGYYCNGAAVCAPCDTARLCGPSCSPCGLSTPYCVNQNGTYTCVECEDDSQCGGRRCDPDTKTCVGCLDDRVCPNGQVCDKPNFTCVECLRDEDCPPDEVCVGTIKQCKECKQNSDCERGKSCQDFQCVTCSTNESCAGNSCNCCPSGTQCAARTPGGLISCVECAANIPCADGKQCDLNTGRCVDTLPECNTSDKCGPQCVKCPSERPFCLDGEVCVACRNDLECSNGQFCISGECASCTTDRHCGPRCEACGKDKPFCLTNDTVAGSTCVACRNDSDCPGGQCDASTFTCVNTTGCEENCTESGKVCNNGVCVQCFADAHCPCGGTCDVSTGLCTTSCDDSGDCLGVEYCSPLTQECERGRRKPGTSPQGGAFCCEATPADLTSTGTGAFLAMVLVGLLLLYSRRAL